MLSDEEIKVMDSLKVISEYTGDNYLAKEHRRKLKLLIELVEKQAKEIEELFAENQSLKYTNGNMIHKDVVKVNYTPNDKIKAKIEELKQKKYILSSRESEIEILKSLLEKE